MSSTKPSAYLSEEARLRAQRRMLAERYGLGVSDDEDEHESADDASASASDTAPDPTEETMQPPQNGPKFVVLSPKRPSPASSPPPPSTRSPRNLTPVSSPSPFAPSSPAVVLRSDGALPETYTYARTEAQIAAAARRMNHIMTVAMYASQLPEGHGRKIAVNDSLVTYVVRGHIRGIVRNSSILALLKGHSETVVDMEFLARTEKRLSPAGPACSVLGSVALDGSAIVWRLLRTDAPDGGHRDDGTFEIADSIPIRHPAVDRGASYSRIAFRPGTGSVVADNGVGVAVLLVDPESPNLRSVELVKMDAKVMARDNTMYADKEVAEDEFSVDPNVPVCACLWLNEDVAVIARGSSILLWAFKTNSCLARVPRQSKAKVHSLHSLDGNVLLVASDFGRTLEVWHAEDITGTPKIRLSQTVHVCDRKAQEEFIGVVSVDPECEVVTVANAKEAFLVVLHYNQSQRGFDALTEVSTSQPMLATTLTRSKKTVSKESPRIGGVRDAKNTDEIGLWYVQPKGIHMMTLSAKYYAPPPGREDLSSSSSSHTSSSSLSKKPFSLDTTQNKLLEPSSTPNLFPLPNRPAAETPRKSPTSSPRIEDQTPKQPITILQPKRLQPKKVPEVKSTTPRKVPGSPEPPSVNKNETVTKNIDADEVADAMLEAAKKAIEQFDEKARNREDAENARTNKVVQSVKETAEANLERAVNTAMKKCMGEIIIPNVSQVLTKMTPDEKAVNATRQEYFADAIQQSDLLKMYEAGCAEILGQISGAVHRSIDDKCANLMDPAVQNIHDASEDIQKTVDALVKQVEAGGFAMANGTGSMESEDVQAKVTRLIEEENFDEAFLTVLNRGDLELVNWLVAQFDPKVFVESHVLSQVATLSLAQQIGQRLGANDKEPNASVEWLRELMLVLVPKDYMIADMAVETLTELRRKVADVMKDDEMMARWPGLGKQLKQLGMVITSLTAE